MCWKLACATILTIISAWVHVGDAFTSLHAGRPSLVSRTWMKMSEGSAAKSLVVISPPGGVGEVTAVKAATMGSKVRWFVVSSSSSENKLALSQECLASISAAGGSVELAGAESDSLLVPEEETESAIGAVSQWCGTADCLVCTFDGVENAERKEGERDPTSVWTDAIKVAAQEAGRSIRGMQLAILPALYEEDAEADEGEGVGKLLSSLLSKGKVAVPPSLPAAMNADVSKVATLRHGELFGIPESSPDFSPFVGGPLKTPKLSEEYSMRSIRVDPTLSVAGNAMVGSKTRSSRLSVGEAAARVALGKASVPEGTDVCISSLRGTDEVSDEEWKEEFDRAGKMLSSGEGALLFQASFSSVPNVERLADWIATKWAPAVLRTYELAGIRIGARPVYAARSGDGRVEIVWQQLVDFESVTVGKLIIQVSDTGLVATRGAGDASKGFGSTSLKPLNGEDVLVRTLADAASQAVEKGLANKPKAAKKEKPAPKKVEAVAPVTSIASSGIVEKAAVASDASLESGPRKAGARRSSQRSRGTRRKKSAPPATKGDSESKAFE